MPGVHALKVTRKKCITKSCFFEKNSNTEQRIKRFCCDFMRRKVDVCLCMDAINPVEKRTSLLLWIGMTCPWKHALSRLTQLTPKGTLRFPKMFKTSGFPCLHGHSERSKNWGINMFNAWCPWAFYSFFGPQKTSRIGNWCWTTHTQKFIRELKHATFLSHGRQPDVSGFPM